jgi:hypothetical protein
LRSLVKQSTWIEFDRLTDCAELAREIDHAFRAVTGATVETNPAYGSLILAIMQKETGFRSYKRMVSWFPIPKPFEKSKGIMQIRLCDPMLGQDFLHYAIRRLDQIVLIYAPDRRLDDERVKFILSDWVAGDYCSRIAAYQALLNSEGGNHLLLDGYIGDLTIAAANRFGDGGPDFQTNMILAEVKRRLTDGSPCDARESRRKFLDSAYFRRLEEKYPFLTIPIVADAPVKNIFHRLLAGIDPGSLGVKQTVLKSNL